jgi:hypothetical protein
MCMRLNASAPANPRPGIAPPGPLPPGPAVPALAAASICRSAAVRCSAAARRCFAASFAASSACCFLIAATCRQHVAYVDIGRCVRYTLVTSPVQGRQSHPPIYHTNSQTQTRRSLPVSRTSAGSAVHLQTARMSGADHASGFHVSSVLNPSLQQGR